MNLYLRRITSLLSMLSLFIIGMQAKNNPVANPDAIVTSGNMRFTVLTPEMIRIEHSERKQFEDRASFIAINRNLPVPQFTTETRDGYLYITTDKVELRYKIGTHPVTSPLSSQNLKITFDLNGASTYWFPGKNDAFNLKGTSRTLDHSSGDNLRSSMEDGILSRSGWVVLDESKSNGDTSKSLIFEKKDGDFDWVAQRKDPNAIDMYFMAYGHNYKKALYDYTQISGKQPMPPLYSFGYWYSKYERYTEQDFKDIVNEIQDQDIPIDIMVVDMDWHYAGHKDDGGRGGWTGWSWNKSLFSDPSGFIDWLHKKNLKTTLNLHPADGIDSHEDNYCNLANDLGVTGNQNIKWNIENETFYKSFFKNILRPHEDIGVDFWWLDWQQWLLAPNEKNLGNTFWLNHVFYNDMCQNRPDKRAMIFHRWGGLGNHRYQIGFSGDSWATFPTLAFQIYFNSTASNVAYGYWSHDLGGHQGGDNDPELYLRWIQFGVFSPMTRTHATNDPKLERRIWKYPNFVDMRDALKLRYALIPYIYTYSREAYDTGLSLCRPLYYDSPEENEAYKQETSYMYGDEMFVTPIVTASNNNIGTVKKQFWLPEGNWYEAETGAIISGSQKYTRTFAQNEIPYYLKEGSIIPMYGNIKHLQNRPDTLILEFYPGKVGEFEYYEDEGDNEKYKQDKFTKTKITQEADAAQGKYTVHARQGAFDNMPSTRSYELRINSKLTPEKVTVDGKTYSYSSVAKNGNWSYDSKNLAIVINIASKECNKDLVVNIDFNDNQKDCEKLIASKKGQMARLIKCNNALKDKLGNYVPGIFTNLVETSNNISKKPESARKELEYFDKYLESAFDLLYEMNNVGTIAQEILLWKEFVLSGYSSDIDITHAETIKKEEDNILIGYNNKSKILDILVKDFESSVNVNIYNMFGGRMFSCNYKENTIQENMSEYITSNGIYICNVNVDNILSVNKKILN